MLLGSKKIFNKKQEFISEIKSGMKKGDIILTKEEEEH